MGDPELVPVDDRPALLIVAGLDPSGGAGVLLDEAVTRAMGLHPVVAATCIAVQNTNRVGKRFDPPPEVLREQLDVLAEEFLLGAVKVGLVGRKESLDALAGWLSDRPRLPVVLDPVLRASSGGALAASGTENALIRGLIPRAKVLTPNLDEAAALTGDVITEREQLPAAAAALRDLGAQWVLLKGGHLPRGFAADYLLGPDTTLWLEEERVGGGAVRGTGCALSTAIAARLALGDPVEDATRTAKAFVTRAIEKAYVAGQGRFLSVGKGL